MSTNIIQTERDNRIIVFIERLEKTRNEKGNREYTIVFDFLIDQTSLTNFIERTSLAFGDKTMMEVIGVKFEKFGTPREGSFYELPEVLISDIEWLQVGDNEEFGSTYLAYKASFIDRPIYFEEALPYQNFIEDNIEDDTFWATLEREYLVPITNEKIGVSVFNVGQGNWNSISFNNRLIITYDFGSSSSQLLLRLLDIVKRKRRILKNVLINQNNGYFEPKYILIISHWDVDHYIGLKSLSEDDIRKFDYCIVPARIENNTTKQIYERLRQLSNIIPIEMNDQIRGERTDALTTIYDSEILKIYKGTKCRDRNKRGLLLSIHTDRNDFVLPADHYYEQIDSYIMPNCTTTSQFNFVVPHHGGKAGNFTLLRHVQNGKDAIISTGGRYGHPFNNIVQQIRSTFSLVHNTLDNHHYIKTI